jgi:uncharacterized protein YjbJ (UPF0337 family)
MACGTARRWPALYGARRAWFPRLALLVSEFPPSFPYKDRIKGSAEQTKGAVKEAAGKVFGDKKLETEGETDKAAGRVQNAVGGLKDALRGKTNWSYARRGLAGLFRDLFVPVPSTIVEIEPSWRGYDYLLVGDQIVIVESAIAGYGGLRRSL